MSKIWSAAFLILALLLSLLPVRALADDSSLLELNPPMRALLATYLVHRDRPMAERIQALDSYLANLETTFRGEKKIRVNGLSDYLLLRNRRFETPLEALRDFDSRGLITPVNIELSNPRALDDILDYENAQVRQLIEFAKYKAPGALQGTFGAQAELWLQLTDIYRLGQSLRDLGSSAAAGVATGLKASGKQVLSDGFRQQGLSGAAQSGLGIFALFAGTGVSIARSVGENVINPFVRERVIAGLALPEFRRRAGDEIRKIRRAGSEQKANMIREIDRHLLRQVVLQGNRALTPALKDAPPELRSLITNEFLPAAFAAMSGPQISQSLWTMLETPGFERLGIEEQFRTISAGIGPLLPYTLHMLTKNKLVNQSQLPEFLCCDLPADRGLSFLESGLESKATSELGALGVEIVAADQQALHIGALKNTFRLQIKEGQSGEIRDVVLQINHPRAREGLKEDLLLLDKLAANTRLIKRFEEAGVPQLDKAMKAFQTLVTDDLDLERTAQMQSRAIQFYETTTAVNLNGRQVDVELRVPRVILATPTILVQEYVGGVSLSEARTRDAAAVQAALEVFAEKYLRSILSSEAFLWAEPLESNFRVEFLSSGRLRLNLVNFGASDVLDQDAIKATIKSLARVPLKTVFNSMSAKQTDAKSSIETFNQLAESGIQISPSYLKIGMGLINLRSLVGKESYQQFVFNFAWRNPNLLFAPCGKLVSARLANAFDRIKHSFTRPVTCEKIMRGGI